MHRSRGRSVLSLVLLLALSSTLAPSPAPASPTPIRWSQGAERTRHIPFTAEKAPDAGRRVTAAVPDVYEAGAGDNDVDTARPLPFAPESHTITDSEDADVFKISGVSRDRYEIETVGTADTLVEVWDQENGWVIAWSDDKSATDLGSKVTWTIPVNLNSRDYYVFVYGANPTAQGDYSIVARLSSGYGPTRVQRVDGANRFVVAMNVARKAFPGWKDRQGKTVSDVIVCNGEDRAMADPLAAASLAGVYHCPVLLTRAKGVPGETAQVINEIRAANGGSVNIHVLGGTTSVPVTAVYNKLAALKGGGTIRRINGANRYDLTGRIADEVNGAWWKRFSRPAPLVYVANGERTAAFYDALAVGPQCYNSGIPLLLTRNTSVPGETSWRIDNQFAQSEVVAVNGSYHMSDSIARRVRAVNSSGVVDRMTNTSDRYWGAPDIAQFGLNNYMVGSDTLAVVNKLPDALTGGAAMGEMRGTIIYTDSPGGQYGTLAWLDVHNSSVKDLYMMGGTTSIWPNNFNAVVSFMNH